MITKTHKGKELEHVYKASAKQVEFVDVPRINFLMVDGKGNPSISQEYMEAIEALYPLSYTLKFGLKKAEGLDYKVAPLEGLWWAEDMTQFSTDHKENWYWTMMIAQPEVITPEWFEKAKVEVRRKKNPAALAKVRLESFHEGSAAQILHVGPYSAEGHTIQKLHAFIHQSGYIFDGRKQKHHEIYLGDPRRVAPEKWKTILRQPFTRP